MWKSLGRIIDFLRDRHPFQRRGVYYIRITDSSCFWWETNGKHKSCNRQWKNTLIVSNNSVRLGYQFGLWSFQVPYPFKQAANASTNHDDVRLIRLMAHGTKQKKWGLSDWNWSVGADDWMETWLVAVHLMEPNGSISKRINLKSEIFCWTMIFL
jgi:hypothetical protein